MKYLWLLLVFVANQAMANSTEAIILNQQRIDIRYQSSFSNQQKSQLHRWLIQIADSITQVYGELPLDSFSVNLRQSNRARGPVPWGQVTRGLPVTVSLTVNANFDYARFIADWTAFHEFSHLLLPYRGYGDLWLSEGIASYYQNIVQARVGLLSEQQMWQKLYAGLERGRKAGKSQLSLRQASDDLRTSREYMRVYWSGVLFWLQADILLRSEHQTSLDDFLKSLKSCCQHRRLSAPDIVKKLDEFASSEGFSALFEQTRQSRQIGDYQSRLTQLGVLTHVQSIDLDDQAELTSVRKAIYTGNK